MYYNKYALTDILCNSWYLPVKESADEHAKPCSDYRYHRGSE